MAKLIRDPKGNELKLVLLQIMERCDQGPTVCRVRYDHEKIGLANPEQREFLMVWTPVDSVLGEMRAEDNDTINSLMATQDALGDAHKEIADTQKLCKQVQAANAALQVEIDQKTTALRDLQRERDPARLEALVQERTKELDTKFAAAQRSSGAEIAQLKSRVTELEASKRKLREALDRIKDGKR